MQKASVIHFLRNHEIDKQKWDNCITASPHGLIYAGSFYLDNICPGWKALVGENYEWVMPVTYKTKFGIPYLYQPPFTQQLGVFAKSDVFIPYAEIVQLLKQHYTFWEINWNYATDISSIISPVRVSARTNLILNLAANYENTVVNYEKHLVRKLKRSVQFKHIYQPTEDFNKCIDFYMKNYGARTPHMKRMDYEKLKNVCSYALKLHMLKGRKITNTDNELLAAALLLQDEKRMYNILNITTETGRKTEANHFLLDSIIREFSGQELLFDFEGSDVPGVKRFYESFGAMNQPYYMIRYNALPWPVRLF